MEPGDAAERQTDEITVLQAMFEEQLEVTGDAPHAFAVRAADATLEVTLPPRYPYEPPQLVLSCPTAAAGAVTAAVQELTALAGGLGAGRGVWQLGNPEDFGMNAALLERGAAEVGEVCGGGVQWSWCDTVTLWSTAEWITAVVRDSDIADASSLMP